MRKFAIVMLTVLLLTCLGGGLTSAAFAASTDYTGPLEDLQQDPDFDVGQYPLVSGDHSIDVIQIAEGAGDELFVYVYQPCGDAVTASSINICQDAPEQSERHWYNYKLQLIALDGALGKYMVEGFTLRSALLRYYDISAIYRLPFGSELTSTLPNGNQTDEVSYEVARCYMAVTVDGKVQYGEQYTEVIPIKKMRVGYVRYLNGFSFMQDSCDSFYVAFSTNHRIDDLYEADVQFVQQYWWREDTLFGTVVDKASSDPATKFVSLSYSDVVANDTWGFGGQKHIWNRIESVSSFVSNEDLQDDVKEDLEDYQWVLRFYEGRYQVHNQTMGRMIDYEKVSEVTILRLMFAERGQTYNLGVVSNKQTGRDEQDNNPEIDDPFSWWKEFVKSWNEFWNGVKEFFQSNWWILVLLGALLLFGILSIFFPVLRVAFKGIWIGLKWLVKILWYIISAPVRLVVWIVNKAKGRKG